jgi:hypothetical protein
LHNFSSTDPVIGYFWRAVRSFTHEERAKLLQFVSGSVSWPFVHSFVDTDDEINLVSWS